MKKWFRQKAIKWAAKLLASEIKDAKIPLLNKGIDKLNERTVIGMLEWLAQETGWKYSEGVALYRIIQLGNHLGEYQSAWEDFWKAFQKSFDTGVPEYSNNYTLHTKEKE